MKTGTLFFNSKKFRVQIFSTFSNLEVLLAEDVYPEPQRRAGLKRYHSTFAGGGLSAKQDQLDEMLRLKKLDGWEQDGTKEEAEVIEWKTPVESLEHPADGKKAFTVLRNVMYRYFAVRNMDFREMGEEREINHGEFLAGAVHVLFADPPYNICRVREDSFSAYNSFTVGDMKGFLSFCKTFIIAGAHCDIFYSACSSDSGISTWGRRKRVMIRWMSEWPTMLNWRAPWRWTPFL